MDTHDPEFAGQTDAATDVFGPSSGTFLIDTSANGLEKIEPDTIRQMKFFRKFKEDIAHAELADFLLATLKDERDLARCRFLSRAKRAEVSAECAAASYLVPDGVQRCEEIRGRLGIVERLMDRLGYVAWIFRYVCRAYLSPRPLLGHSVGEPSFRVNTAEPPSCCIGCGKCRMQEEERGVPWNLPCDISGRNCRHARPDSVWKADPRVVTCSWTLLDQ